MKKDSFIFLAGLVSFSCCACSSERQTGNQANSPGANTRSAMTSEFRFLKSEIRSEQSRKATYARFVLAKPTRALELSGWKRMDGFEIRYPDYRFEWRSSMSREWKSEPLDVGSFMTPPDTATVEKGGRQELLFEVSIDIETNTMNATEFRACLSQDRGSVLVCSSPFSPAALHGNERADDSGTPTVPH